MKISEEGNGKFIKSNNNQKIMKIKKVLIVCLLLLFNLTFTGCSMWDIFAPDEEIQRAVDKGDKGMCLAIKDKDANEELKRKNKCLDKVAEKTNDPKACKMIVGDANRMNRCFKTVAVGLGKEDICEEINDDKLKMSCFADVGIASGNESLCAKEGLSVYDKRECYTEIAKNKKDETICDNIENERSMAECYKEVGVIAESVEICKKILATQEIWKVNCINNIAMNQKNVKVCYEHTDENQLGICISIMAEELSDAALCEDIIGEEVDHNAISLCIGEVAKKKRDKGICANIIDIGFRNMCYSRVAIARGEISICDEIKDSRCYMDECYMEIAKETGQMDLCLSMNLDDSKRQLCYLSASKKADDASLCKNVEDSEDQFDCILNVAQYQRDASHCGKNITSQGTREKCIHEVVRKYKTDKVCEPITDSGDKEKCLASYRILSQ